MDGSTVSHRSTDELLAPIASALTKRVSHVARVFYEIGGVVDETNGGLEVGFDDGSVIYVDCASDGESLQILPAAWHDPFVQPISEENQAFVAASGKWSRFDRSHSTCYAHLVGQRLVDFEPFHLDDRRLGGVALRFTGGSFIRAQALADELIVNAA